MRTLIWIIIALVVIGGGIWWFTAQPAEAPTSENDNEPALNGDNTTITDPSNGDNITTANTINYTSSGFTPQTITVSQGESVTFVNESSGDMRVASAVHPSHAVYGGTTRSEHCPDPDNTAFDQCQTSDTYTFTFDKAGEWNYHNHVNAGDTGTIIVE